VQESFDNRYRVPGAEVGDYAPGEDRAPRPMTVTVALVLLWSIQAVMFAMLVASWLMFTSSSRTDTLFAAMIAVMWLLNTSLLIMVHRGQNWARITFLLLYLLGLPFALYSLGEGPARDPLSFQTALLQIAMKTTAMILLFVGPARAWFRHRA
jgi:hypothetical protein